MKRQAPTIRPCHFWTGFLFALVLLAGPASAPARAQDTLRAVAVVNDEVISRLDLDMRTRLAVLASGVTPSPQTLQRMQHQILRRLIDERLQVQEAERIGISVPDEDINEAVTLISRGNGMSRDEFLAALKQNSILPMALLDRIRAELSWRQVARVRLLPTVEIGDEEVDEVVGRIEANRGQPEMRLSEIVLEVENALIEEEVWKSTVRLMEQIKDGGNFAALARQFSQSATAPAGGELGWMQQSQLSDELTTALAGLRVGQMVGPVRTLSGFYILFLHERRDTTPATGSVNLKQIFFDLPAGAGSDVIDATKARAAEIRGQVRSCADVDRIAAEVGAPGSGDLGTMELQDLPANLRKTVAGLPLQQPSQPLEVSGGVSLLVVCAREGAGPDRAAIEERLRQERLNMLARRYLRGLRRAANVDIRQ
jgi:peptidyl-prolyl cis-trans isomerase SurA